MTFQPVYSESWRILITSFSLRRDVQILVYSSWIFLSQTPAPTSQLIFRQNIFTETENEEDTHPPQPLTHHRGVGFDTPFAVDCVGVLRLEIPTGQSKAVELTW